MERFVLASGNRGKVAEINALVQPAGMEVVPQSAFGISPAAETAATFVENALLKARHAAAGSGLPAIADDSGLVVDALDGAPGVFSARYAGPDANDADNNRKLLAELADVPPGRRTARFVCLLVLVRHPRDPLPVLCQGTWEGTVLETPRGEAGFGYDPLFLPAGSGHSAAEMTPAKKNQSSHRARAFACLMERLGRV